MAAKESAQLDENEFGAFSLDDAERLYTLDRRCILSPWTLEGFKEDLGQLYTHCWGRNAPDGTIMAFITSHLVLDEAHILKIGVAPEYRDQGIGTRLMRYALAQFKARNVRFVYLEVRKSNTAARNFYLKNNFKEHGIRKDYYGKDEGYLIESEDAVLYLCEL